MRFLFFIYSIVMNITCLFCTWPYSCIWLRNIVIFGARTWAYRSWYGLRPGYHDSTETIREAAKNNWKSVSERLVQAIEGEREREREKTQGPQKIRNQEKRPKTRRTNSAPPRKKKENVQHRKKKKNSATPKEKKKGRHEKKRKKRSNTTQLQEKKKEKGMKKRKRIRRYLLNYVCHSLIYE